MGEFISAIMDTLAAGALAKADGLGGQAVTDLYETLKNRLIGLLGKSGAVQGVEDEPESEAARAYLTATMAKVDLKGDPDLESLVEALRVAISDTPPINGPAIKVGSVIGANNASVTHLEGNGNIEIRSVEAKGGDAVVSHLKMTSDGKKKD